jgi:hypothetical protein
VYRIEKCLDIFPKTCMEHVQIAAHGLDQIATSPYFIVAHSIRCAYFTRNRSPQDTFFKSCLSTILYGFGGSIIVNLLLGEPINVIFNPFLAVYIVSTFLMYYLQEIISMNIMIIKPCFKFITAVSSGKNMIRVLSRFRKMNVGSKMGSDSPVSLILIGVIAASGGSLLHTWIIKKDMFSVLNPFLKIATFASLVINFLMIQSENGTVFAGIDTSLCGDKEFQLVAFALLFTGLLFETGIDPNAGSRRPSVVKEDFFVAPKNESPIKETPNISVNESTPKTSTMPSSPAKDTPVRRSGRNSNK